MPQGQLTSVELLSLQAKFVSLKRDCGHITTKTLPGLLKKLKGLNELVSDEDIGSCLLESYAGRDQEVDFDSFVQVYQSLQARVTANEGANEGGGGGGKALPSFLKSNTTTLQYNPDEAEKLCYVVHINTYLGEDPFLKNYLPIDPTGNQLFDLVRDGVLLCKLINVAVPGTIDERAINKKRSLNLWERNENHTLCLKSATAIGCTVINIGAQDLEEGRPHLVLGLVSQIIKIHKAKITQRESMDVDGPCSEGSMFSDSCEDMRNGGSQNAVSSPDGDSGLGDMGDADSDISNLEAFLSQDETESEDDEFNIEDELDDDEYQLDSYNQSLEAPDKGAEEEAKHNDDIVNILDDYYEMQVECGLVTRWAFINYSTLPYIKSQRFLDKLQNTCLSLGMADFANQPIREFRETVDLATVKDLLDALKIELVLLIPPCFVYNYGMEEKKDKIEQIEKKIEQIEQMCESLGIAYQSCHPLDPKGTKSLAREIQFKVVKRLILLRRLELPLVREAPTIIFGADMVEVEDSKSVASVVASVDWPKFRKYFGAISLQPYNGGVIKDFCSGGMMIKYLNFFYKKNGERPKRLIFFRNGLEEGQLDYICQQEIYAIKQASVKEGYPLSLTYVIVLPRKVWRGTLSKNEHGTPLPYPVFACRHSTERVSMVSHYCVFHDDNNFPAGQLQALTSQLRTFRHRWENPRLNTVVPAFLARQKIFEELRKRELI